MHKTVLLVKLFDAFSIYNSGMTTSEIQNVRPVLSDRTLKSGFFPIVDTNKTRHNSLQLIRSSSGSNERKQLKMNEDRKSTKETDEGIIKCNARRTTFH